MLIAFASILRKACAAYGKIVSSINFLTKEKRHYYPEVTEGQWPLRALRGHEIIACRYYFWLFIHAGIAFECFISMQRTIKSFCSKQNNFMIISYDFATHWSWILSLHFNYEGVVTQFMIYSYSFISFTCSIITKY